VGGRETEITDLQRPERGFDTDFNQPLEEASDRRVPLGNAISEARESLKLVSHELQEQSPVSEEVVEEVHQR
jgi:hypothetical protein